MCQAYEAERRLMVSGEKFARQTGWDAQKQGVALEDNPKFLPSDVECWASGWRMAKQGLPRPEY